MFDTNGPTPSEIYLDIDWFDPDYVYDDILDNYETITGDAEEFFERLWLYLPTF